MSVDVVLIAPATHLSALERAEPWGDAALAFVDTDALRAFDAITRQRPRLVVLQRTFASGPRGSALVNRIKIDPALAHCEVRVLDVEADDVPTPPPPPVPMSPAPHATTTDAYITPAIAAPDEAVPAADEPMVIVTAGGEIVIGGSHTPSPTTSSATTVPVFDMPEVADTPYLDPEGTRREPRVTAGFPSTALLDGNPADLVELSATGAQVVSTTVLKPKQRVRLAVGDGADALKINAAVVWATFEFLPGKPGPCYRAGLEFGESDQPAVRRFLSR